MPSRFAYTLQALPIWQHARYDTIGVLPLLAAAYRPTRLLREQTLHRTRAPLAATASDMNSHWRPTIACEILPPRTCAAATVATSGENTRAASYGASFLPVTIAARPMSGIWYAYSTVDTYSRYTPEWFSAPPCILPVTRLPLSPAYAVLHCHALHVTNAFATLRRRVIKLLLLSVRAGRVASRSRAVNSRTVVVVIT